MMARYKRLRVSKTIQDVAAFLVLATCVATSLFSRRAVVDYEDLAGDVDRHKHLVSDRVV